MITKRLTPKDVEKHKNSMIFMLQQSFEKSFPGQRNNFKSFEQRIESLIEYLNNSKAIVYGILDYNVLIGFIWFFEADCYKIHINHFVVDEKHRGKGIGKILWSKVEEYANCKKIPDIELIVTKENEIALNFYMNRNFKVNRLILKKRL